MSFSHRLLFNSFMYKFKSDFDGKLEEMRSQDFAMFTYVKGNNSHIQYKKNARWP